MQRILVEMPDPIWIICNSTVSQASPRATADACSRDKTRPSTEPVRTRNSQSRHHVCYDRSGSLPCGLLAQVALLGWILCGRKKIIFPVYSRKVGSKRGDWVGKDASSCHSGADPLEGAASAASLKPRKPSQANYSRPKTCSPRPA